MLVLVAGFGFFFMLTVVRYYMWSSEGWSVFFLACIHIVLSVIITVVAVALAWM